MRAIGEKDYQKILLEAIDEGLTILGDSGKHMVFFYLERNYSIRKHDIPKNPEAFIDGLEKIFGSGASVLEKMILKCMCSKLGLTDDEIKGRTLTDCIREANVPFFQSSQNPREQYRDNNRTSKAAESYSARNDPDSVLTATL